MDRSFRAPVAFQAVLDVSRPYAEKGSRIRRRRRPSSVRSRDHVNERPRGEGQSKVRCPVDRELNVTVGKSAVLPCPANREFDRGRVIA